MFFEYVSVTKSDISSWLFNDIGDGLKPTFGNIQYSDHNPITKKRELVILMRYGRRIHVFNCFRTRFFPHFWIQRGLVSHFTRRGDQWDVVVGSKRYGFIVDDGSFGVSSGRLLGRLVRVNVWRPFYVPVVRQFVRGLGGSTFESRVPFVARFMIDFSIRPYTDRVAYWDLETDSRVFAEGIDRESMKKARILSIAVCDSRGKYKVFADSDEAILLKRFMEHISKYDVMVGYNSGYKVPNHRNFMDEKSAPGFDLPVLWYRLQQNGLYEFAELLRFWEWFDLYPILKRLAKGHAQKSLGAVLEREVGLRKYGSGEDVTRMSDEELVAYNMVDAYNTMYLDWELGITRTWLIKRALGLLPSLSQVSTHLPVEGNNRPITYLVMWYSEHYGEPKTRLLDGDMPRKEGKIEGGYVLDPVAGVWRKVAVLDFAGTYPSIIQEPKAGVDPTANGAYPVIAGKLVAERKKYKKLLKEAVNTGQKLFYDTMQYVFKILANAMYGVLGFVGVEDGKKVYSPLYSVEDANKITSIARMVLITIVDKLRGEGYKILYGDTDSMMVYCSDWEGRSLGEVVELAEGLRDHVNDLLSEMGFRVLRVKLERIFDPVVFFAGKKKRYFGRVVWEGEECSEWVFKGCDIVRADTPLYIRPYLMMFVELLGLGVPYAEALRVAQSKLLKDLYDGKLDDKLVQSKRLTKPIEEYKSNAEHVQAARKALRYGYRFSVGDRVYYVRAVTGWEPVIPGRKVAIDYRYYVERAKSVFERFKI